MTANDRVRELAASSGAGLQSNPRADELAAFTIADGGRLIAMLESGDVVTVLARADVRPELRPAGVFAAEDLLAHLAPMIPTALRAAVTYHRRTAPLGDGRLIAYVEEEAARG